MAFGQDADRHALLGFGVAGGGLVVALAGGASWPVGAALVPLGLAWAGLFGHVAPLAFLVVAPVAVPLGLWLRLRGGWVADA